MVESTDKGSAKDKGVAKNRGSVKKKGGEREVLITQLRSAIGRPRRQRDTLRALGIRRLGASVKKRATPAVMGMVRKVAHLVVVSDVG